MIEGGGTCTRISAFRGNPTRAARLTQARWCAGCHGALMIKLPLPKACIARDGGPGRILNGGDNGIRTRVGRETEGHVDHYIIPPEMAGIRGFEPLLSGRQPAILTTIRYPQMVRKMGFDPTTSCTPSTRSAWLSYFLIKDAPTGA